MAKIFAVVWLNIVALVIVFSYAVHQRWTESMVQARQHFIEISHKDTMGGIEKLNNSFKSIYENLRTLSYLPGVRGTDRHATNFTPEAKVTFQQIYNNLASNLDVSEVYVVPLDLSPDKFDPITLAKEAPIMMFDHLIVNAGNGMSNHDRMLSPEVVAKKTTTGPEEVEIFEYRQLMEHLAWFKSNVGTIDKVEGFDLPFISGKEVITCDNSQFITTLADKDRSGIIFSVPFYGEDGKLKGSISAILLTNKLKTLLPNSNLALINLGNGYINGNLGAVDLNGSSKYLEQGVPDPKLIYSEVEPLPLVDSRSPWQVWAGLPDKSFTESEVVKTANRTRWREYLTLIGLTLAAAICVYLVQINLSQARRLNNIMKQERDKSAMTEAEAIQSSETFQTLNNDISRLNSDLAEKIQLLTLAQEDIVQKGKMAQLGNLVATVAHELRNPLGGVRTTTFLLRRKLKDSPIDVEAQLDRIEIGVTRCDNIISQLLDFSRSQPLVTEKKDLNIWLQEVLVEEATKISEHITINCVLSAQQVLAEVDTERLRRGVINLLTNAADAMVTKAGLNLVRNGHKPAIDVELNETSRGVEIKIRDNGPGIPAELMSRISEPLFTTKSFGTGLGLAAVRKVAEMHGGGLEINSIDGHGASFTIWFPTKNAATIAA